MPYHPLVYVLLGFLIAELASMATSVYLHRGSTHRAVKFHPWVEFLIQLGLWLTTGVNRLQWVAVHLCHHAHADKEGDPHSPLILGFWKVQLGNAFYYFRAARDPRVLWYAKHIKPILAERTVFRFSNTGLLIGIGIAWAVFGFLPMLVIAGTHAVLYLFVINNLVNGWCHVRGYKNFPATPAFNNRLIAWLTVGEGLHNNHHHEPASPTFQRRRSEIDLGWICIRLLCSLNLATLASAPAR
ncbi:MAG: fatty acid desaturase [bacterium]|nr:fatty acid desaturase [bacterium]